MDSEYITNADERCRLMDQHAYPPHTSSPVPATYPHPRHLLRVPRLPLPLPSKAYSPARLPRSPAPLCWWVVMPMIFGNSRVWKPRQGCAHTEGSGHGLCQPRDGAHDRASDIRGTDGGKG